MLVYLCRRSVGYHPNLELERDPILTRSCAFRLVCAKTFLGLFLVAHIHTIHAWQINIHLGYGLGDLCVDVLDLDSLFELDAVNIPHTLKFCPKYQVRIHTPSD